jgi:hypothetical protein
MLVARRDPPFEACAHEQSSAHSVPRSSRVLHGLQLIGSFLAIPVGLASAYSIYHTNFTAESRCETLRSNIVSMLDKNADPAALRMLVRRDVVTFESSCGSVDPDAVAAFRKLLAGGQVAARRANPHEQSQPSPEPARQQAVQPLPVKKPAAAEAKPARPESTKSVRRETEAKPVRREIEVKPVTREAVREQASDAEWLEAVRGAMVHAPAAPAAEKENARWQAAPPPKLLGELRAPAATAAPAIVQAPVLAPATSVAATPRPATDSDHPVPPGSIPEATTEMTASVPAEKPERSRIKALIADIPLLGRVVRR